MSKRGWGIVAGLALLGLALVAQAVAAAEESEPLRCHVLDGGPGDGDRVIGDLGDDEVLGGPGDRDEAAGGLGIDFVNGGPGDEDLVRGDYGWDRMDGGSGSGDTASFATAVAGRSGGGGLAFVGGDGSDVLTVAYDDNRGLFGVFAAAGIALGDGCTRPNGDPKQAICDPEGPARWVMADLGPGDDRLRVEGSLASAGSVRIGGGRGNDRIQGGPEDDLIESGPGADRIYGGAGADGLIGGLPGPTFLYGEAHGDLLAAGGGCAGGALVGGPGRDNASFAETQAHPGLLYISLARGAAWIDAIRGCRKVRLARSNENIEGSFDNDVLIGDAGPNMMLGQPGEDSFYGRGGEDIVDARDGVRDGTIQCGRSRPSGRAITDPIDPPATNCKLRTNGSPIPGLHQ